MSELISHTAFYNDIVRLLPYKKNIHKDLLDSLKHYPEYGAISTGTRGNHLYAVPLLEKAKNQKSKKKAQEENKKSIAAAIGWLMHRAIDLTMKPLSLNKLDESLIPSPSYSGEEGEIVQDAISFEYVFDRGSSVPDFNTLEINAYLLSKNFSEFPLEQYLLTDQLQDIYAQVTTSAMLSLFYTTSGAKNAKDYITEFYSGFQAVTENPYLYFLSAEEIPELKRKLYLDRIDYYNLEDEIIKLSQIAKKGKVDPEKLEQALESKTKISAYGSAIVKGFRFLDGVNSFYVDEISKAELYDVVENFYEPHRI